MSLKMSVWQKHRYGLLVVLLLLYSSNIQVVWMLHVRCRLGSDRSNSMHDIMVNWRTAWGSIGAISLIQVHLSLIRSVKKKIQEELDCAFSCVYTNGLVKLIHKSSNLSHKNHIFKVFCRRNSLDHVLLPAGFPSGLSTRLVLLYK